jgi:hypothetical protein
MGTILFPDEWHVNPRLSGAHASLIANIETKLAGSAAAHC